MSRKKRILVHQIGSLGDTIVSIPALRMVRRKYEASAEITLLTNEAPAEIVKSSDVLEGTGLVDKFLRYRLGTTKAEMLKSVSRLWLTVAKERFDTVVYLMESEKTEQTVQRDERFFALCGIRQRLGFVAFPREIIYARDASGFPKEVPHEAFRRADRISKFGFGPVLDGDLNEPFLKAPEVESSAAKAWLAQYRITPEKKLVAICPASKMKSKMWPADRFIEIGRRLVDDGRFELVVIGGPGDRRLATELIAGWGTGVNAAGEFSVMGSAALLHQCAFVIAVDSGPMHLAAVGGIPCVALFSSIDYPGRFSPLGRNHIVLRHGQLSCAACRLTDCPVEGHPCMTGISVDETWQAVKRVSGSVGAAIS